MTGLPGAKPHGSDICVSTPWASEYVIKRVIPMGWPRTYNSWAPVCCVYALSTPWVIQLAKLFLASSVIPIGVIRSIQSIDAVCLVSGFPTLYSGRACALCADIAD